MKSDKHKNSPCRRISCRMKVRPNIRKENPPCKSTFILLKIKPNCKKQYAAIFFFVSAQLSSIQMHLQRRNRHLVKQEDAVVIAVHLLRMLLGFRPNGPGIALSLEICSQTARFLNVPGTTAVVERCASPSNGSVIVSKTRPASESVKTLWRTFFGSLR
ncbi:hypothetical protein BJQ97_00410 [Geobacillus sp. TFV-3]|nr:hypothetical protein BJQ97_00410 [Geobacillus sp. TFV-3]